MKNVIQFLDGTENVLSFLIPASFLLSESSRSFNASSKSGRDPLKSVIPLNKSCKGGVNFKEATAIVAKKGIISTKFSGFLFEKNGNNPIENIKVIPKGSTRDLGNSKSIAHKYLYAFLLLIYLKYFQNLLNAYQ